MERNWLPRNKKTKLPCENKVICSCWQVQRNHTKWLQRRNHLFWISIVILELIVWTWKYKASTETTISRSSSTTPIPKLCTQQHHQGRFNLSNKVWLIKRMIWLQKSAMGPIRLSSIRISLIKMWQKHIRMRLDVLVLEVGAQSSPFMLKNGIHWLSNSKWSSCSNKI